MLFVFIDFYFVVCTLLLTFVISFMFRKLFRILLFYSFFLHSSCTLLKYFIICDLFFAFCVLLKHFSFWCSHSIEALLALLKHFTFWCLCFMFCEVLCCNIFHFGGCVSCSIVCVPLPCALQCIFIFKCFTTFGYIFLPLFVFCFHLHVFICSFS
jgi:hypothetical protein